MTRHARLTRFGGAGVALLAGTALILTGCAGGSADAGQGASGVDAATASDLTSFGTLADLEAAAKAEGQLNVIALPRDWANYGEILDAFTAKYPEITVNEQSPDVSRAEEIQAADDQRGPRHRARRLRPRPHRRPAEHRRVRPLQGADLGRDPRCPQGADRPVRRRLRRIHVGRLRLGEVRRTPTSLDDLLGSEFRGSVAHQRRPDPGGRSLRRRGPRHRADRRHAGRLPAGHRLLLRAEHARQHAQARRHDGHGRQRRDPGRLRLGLPQRHARDGQPATGRSSSSPAPATPGTTTRPSTRTPRNPAAARLWQEFLYSDEVQNLWLKGGARPVRMEAMTDAGTIDEELAAALPEAPPTRSSRPRRRAPPRAPCSARSGQRRSSDSSDVLDGPSLDRVTSPAGPERLPLRPGAGVARRAGRGSGWSPSPRTSLLFLAAADGARRRRRACSTATGPSPSTTSPPSATPSSSRRSGTRRGCRCSPPSSAPWSVRSSATRMLGLPETGIVRTTVDAASGVLAQFGGVMLAFAFIATIGTQGIVTKFLLDRLRSRHLRRRRLDLRAPRPDPPLHLLPGAADDHHLHARPLRAAAAVGRGEPDARRHPRRLLAITSACPCSRRRSSRACCCCSPMRSRRTRRPPRSPARARRSCRCRSAPRSRARPSSDARTSPARSPRHDRRRRGRHDGLYSLVQRRAARWQS